MLSALRLDVNSAVGDLFNTVLEPLDRFHIGYRKFDSENRIVTFSYSLVFEIFDKFYRNSLNRKVSSSFSISSLASISCFIRISDVIDFESSVVSVSNHSKFIASLELILIFIPLNRRVL